MRSDRNLYSKQLLESQEEIQALTKKYTRMTHQVEQLKEELKQKNTQLVHQDMDFSKYVGENEKIAQDKEQAKQKIRFCGNLQGCGGGYQGLRDEHRAVKVPDRAGAAGEAEAAEGLGDGGQ